MGRVINWALTRPGMRFRGAVPVPVRRAAPGTGSPPSGVIGYLRPEVKRAELSQYQ